MNSEAGQKLSLEELKGRNLPQTSGPQEQSLQAEVENLLAVASALYRQEQEDQAILKQLAERTAAHTDALERLSAQREDTSTQAQLEALVREVAQLRTEVRQAGRKKELSISPPGLDTVLSVLAWLVLLLLGTIVGIVVLRTIWSGLAAVWSAVKVLIP